jgi:hypothetical protein
LQPTANKTHSKRRETSPIAPLRSPSDLLCECFFFFFFLVFLVFWFSWAVLAAAHNQHFDAGEGNLEGRWKGERVVQNTYYITLEIFTFTFSFSQNRSV